MRVVAERVRPGFMVSLVIETIVAAAHVAVGASTPEPRSTEARGFTTGKIR